MVTALIGRGSHGKDIEAIWYRTRNKHLYMYDDDPNTFCPAPPDDLDAHLIFGSNYPSIRKSLAERFSHLEGAAALVDPSTSIGPEVSLGRGVVVAPHVVILRSTVFEDSVHANYGVGITRAHVGAYTSLSPGATVCGDVVIGQECLIGANATICDRVTIGNRVTVAAGAIVPPESIVPDDAKVIGVFKS